MSLALSPISPDPGATSYATTAPNSQAPERAAFGQRSPLPSSRTASTRNSGGYGGLVFGITTLPLPNPQAESITMSTRRVNSTLAHGSYGRHSRASVDTSRKIKIPNACDGLDVEWMCPFGMLRREQAQFVLRGRT